MSSPDAFHRSITSTTTKPDLIEEINGSRVISTVLDEAIKKSNIDKDEIVDDIATLVATRMDYVWKTSMTEEEAEMEGISNVSEKDVENVTKKFQEKYKLSDKHIEEIHNGLTKINPTFLERCEGNKKSYLMMGLKVCMIILKIVLFFVIGPAAILIPF